MPLPRLVDGAAEAISERAALMLLRCRQFVLIITPRQRMSSQSSKCRRNSASYSRKPRSKRPQSTDWARSPAEPSKRCALMPSALVLGSSCVGPVCSFHAAVRTSRKWRNSMRMDTATRLSDSISSSLQTARIGFLIKTYLIRLFQMFQRTKVSLKFLLTK